MRKDERKTETQLIGELAELRTRIVELEDSELKYRTLFEDSRDAIYITSKEGIIIEFNQAAIELFGYSREEILKLNVQNTYVNLEDRERFQKEIRKNGSVKDFEVKLRKKDGTVMDCLITSTVRRTIDGIIMGYQGIIRDISDLKEHEKQLLNVVINTSHLINTPLTIVFGYLELIKLGVKKISPELIDVFHEKLSEIRSLLIEELGMKIQELTQKTSDGWTPVKKGKEEQIHETNYGR